LEQRNKENEGKNLPVIKKEQNEIITARIKTKWGAGLKIKSLLQDKLLKFSLTMSAFPKTVFIFDAEYL